MAAMKLGEGDLTIEQVCAIALGHGAAELSLAPAAVERVARSARHVENTLARDGLIYGVTTGFGASVTTRHPR